jgi:hypothetical protein
MRVKATTTRPDPRHVRWLDKWGDAAANFTRDLFGDPAFESVDAARVAWPACRRAVWGNLHRFRVPSAAELFDGITFESCGVVRDGWHADVFPLAEALAAVAEDREHLAAFRERDPQGAATIADYLEMFEADLEMVETTARALAALPGPSFRRPYPQHLGSATTYSGSPETA